MYRYRFTLEHLKKINKFLNQFNYIQILSIIINKNVQNIYFFMTC